MKKYISASTDTITSLDELTQSEIDALPDYFTCYTRYPGTTVNTDVFKIVRKNEFLKNPEKCFFIDSYWGYAFPRDIYIATDQDVEGYRKYRLEQLDKEKNNIDKEYRNLISRTAKL